MRSLRALRLRCSGVRADALVTLALAALWQLELWRPAWVPGVGPTDRHRAALTLAGLVMLLPLAARRSAPLASCALVMGGSVLADAAGPSPEGLSEVAGLLLASYSVACHAGLRRALAGLLILALAIGMAQGFAPDDSAFAALLLGGAWTVGRMVRAGRTRTRELEALTEELAREREGTARMAVGLERTRIARELHDVVAHAVSVMVVQAGGVRGLLDDAQQEEREALAVIEATGREAMQELRRMVGILRAPVDAAGLAPPPSLAHVPALAEHVRDAGLPVEVTFEGRTRTLPPGLELSAYRVVQEALTNTLKHAGPAHARVAVRYRDRALELDVRDDGAGPRNAGATGHGLVGMRERVGLFGGELHAGGQPSGGYRVLARFPLGGAE